jgi:hypothetical protein
LTVWRAENHPESWEPRYTETGRAGWRFRGHRAAARPSPGGGALWDLRMREEVAANRARVDRLVNGRVWQRAEGGPARRARRGRVR